MQLYLTIAAKLAVGFACLLLYLKLSGRAQLAPNSAVDQIGNYVLGGIIGGVLYNPAVSILEMAAVLVMWAVLMLVTRYVKNHNRTAKSIIDGRSVQVFHDGRIDTRRLAQARLSVRDFIANLHMQGIYRLDELESVWIETNGHYTILRRGETPFGVTLIEDGAVAQEYLAELGRDRAWLDEELRAQGFQNAADVAFAEWYAEAGESAGKLHIYPYA